MKYVSYLDKKESSGIEVSLHDLNVIIKSSNKLKESIYTNKIILQCTKEQEKAFYSMVYSILNNTINYIENNKEADHVKKTLEYLNFLNDEMKDSEISYDYNVWKNKISKIYEEEKNEGNVVAAIEALIFWPLRLTNEKMYRELTGHEFDHSIKFLT